MPSIQHDHHHHSFIHPPCTPIRGRESVSTHPIFLIPLTYEELALHDWTRQPQQLGINGNTSLTKEMGELCVCSLVSCRSFVLVFSFSLLASYKPQQLVSIGNQVMSLKRVGAGEVVLQHIYLYYNYPLCFQLTPS